MPRQAPVQVRTQTPVDFAVDDGPQRLYRPVPQLAEAPKLKLATPLVTQEMANEWLRHSDSDATFRNRPVRTNDVRRWRLLMQTGRFVQWLPDGPFLFDEDNIMLNGKHRVTALAGHDQPMGLITIRGVPRWMMTYFDTGRGRSLGDLFTISGRMTKAQTGSTMRLAMRYEEFLSGKRGPYGWKQWASRAQAPDELTDIDDFLARREPLTDLYGSAEQTSRASRLVIAALMVFRFYQELAWPDGDRELLRFWQGLAEGAMLAPGMPALVLREWARDIYDNTDNRVPAKREAHLMLLNRFFALSVQADKVHSVQFGYGMPMLSPYHPDGSEKAAANVRAALAHHDSEYDATRTAAAP